MSGVRILQRLQECSGERLLIRWPNGEREWIPTTELSRCKALYRRHPAANATGRGTRS